MKFCFFLITISCCVSIYSQDLSQRALQKLDDEDLLELFNEVDQDSIKAEIVARVYLERAKKEKDTIKMARGYDRLARIFSPKKNIQYADSIIILTKKKNHITYPALGYILKGYEYRNLGSIIQETENFMKAYEISVNNNNISQQLYVADKLILSKSIWGNKREALELQIKTHEIINKKDFINKINESTRKGAKKTYSNIYQLFEISSLQNFSFCYLNLKMLDSTLYFANKGLQKSYSYNGYNKDIYIMFFKEIFVEIEYYNSDYQKAIINCDELLINKNLNNKTLQNIYLFKGLSQLKLNDYENGILNLIKSDSIFEVNNLNITQPYQRILFEKLLEHYNSINNIEQKIKYLNKLISADSIIKINYQYFEPELIKNFETPILIKEKEQLISELEIKNKNSKTTIWWSLGLLLIALISLIYYFRKQHKYKKRFDQLMIKTESGNKKSSETTNNEIPKALIEHILNRLDQFEENRGYLSKNISLMGMAKDFGTNYKYLSRVVNLNKAKRFSAYINDMRVNYAFQELKNNSKFRKFTIKAIALECGFKCPQSFTKAFYKVYGLYPSFYINQLENKKGG